MKQVRRGNKVLTIDDMELDGYLKEGFDELDEKGAVKTASPAKTYTAAEVEKLTVKYEAKIAVLDAEIAKYKKKLGKKGEGVIDGVESASDGDPIGMDGPAGEPAKFKA